MNNMRVNKESHNNINYTKNITQNKYQAPPLHQQPQQYSQQQHFQNPQSQQQQQFRQTNANVPMPVMTTNISSRAGNTSQNLTNLLKREIGLTNTPNSKVTDISSPMINNFGKTISAPINKTLDEFGIIIAMKDTFGFIQPFHCEDQVYFSLDKDSYMGAQINDEVCYIKRMSNKGFHAERVRLVNINCKEIIQDLKATVIREPDMYKAIPGLLELARESLLVLRNTSFGSIIDFTGNPIYIPFLQNDLVIPNNNNIKVSKRIHKGDEVSFSLSYIPRSTYYRGLSVSFLQSKRDKIIYEQIQNMINSGIKREWGIIDTIKSNEYGFIKPVNRNYQIYFRIEDVIDDTVELVEDMEVEFFIISETTKGKTSDRAVHLSTLPKGTVQFEINISRNAIGVVINEPINSPNEKPGKIKLNKAISDLDKSVTLPVNNSLEYIELWKRCLPDDLLLYVGDTIEFDVQYYYPEKIFFARNVKIKSYRKLSREYGTVVSLKIDSNFGFIKSYIREIDFYFRISEVRDINGTIINSSTLNVDDIMGFDIFTIEDNKFNSSNGSSNNSNSIKLRAIRVQLMSSHNNSGTKTTDTNDIIDLKYIPIETGLIGKIAKLAQHNKRDNSYSPGHIKMDQNDLERIKDGNYFPKDLTKSLDEFITLPDITEISIKYLTSGQRKMYHSIIDSLYSHVLEHKSLQLPPGSVESGDPSKGRVLKISKKIELTDISNSNIRLTSPKHSPTSLAKTNIFKAVNNVTDSNNAHSNENGLETDIVLYQKYDSDDIFGPLAKDLSVSYDLYIDKRTQKKVGRNVRLTDEPIIESHDELCSTYLPIFFSNYIKHYISTHLSSQHDNSDISSYCFGIIDSIVGVRSGRFGFLRKLISDEKLFYHSSSIIVENVNDIDNVQAGQEVAFQLRRRGGLRCACNIILLPHQSLLNEIEISSSKYDGVIVDSNHAVLLDILPNNIEYYNKYWNINYLTSTISKGNSEIKYFPLLSRELIEFTQLSDVTVSPGDLVSCHLVVNWSLHRQPINIKVIEKLSNSIQKIKGILSKIKFKKNSLFATNVNKSLIMNSNIPESEENSDLHNNLDLCEIKVNLTNNKNGVTIDSHELYYCLYNEIILKDNSKDHIQEGDSVEFYPIKEKSLAVHVVYIPKITFRGPSTELTKVAKPKYGIQGITMAKGPPQDTAVGFEKGWRETIDISQFEWAHLLPHLK